MSGVMLARAIQGRSGTRFSGWQRLIACVLLVMVVVFLAVDPLWECHDHLDNLRHLGPGGVLLVILLFACAAITLFKSFWSFSLTGLRALPLDAQLPGSRDRRTRGSFRFVFPSDFALPLRI